MSEHHKRIVGEAYDAQGRLAYRVWMGVIVEEYHEGRYPPEQGVYESLDQAYIASCADGDLDQPLLRAAIMQLVHNTCAEEVAVAVIGSDGRVLEALRQK